MRPDPPDVAGLSFDEVLRAVAAWMRQPRSVGEGVRSVGLIELELQDWAPGDASEAEAHEPKVWTLAFLRGAMRSEPTDAPETLNPVDRAEWGIELDLADHEAWRTVTSGSGWSWESSVGWFMVGDDGVGTDELMDAFAVSGVARAARSSELLAVREYDSLTRLTD